MKQFNNKYKDKFKQKRIKELGFYWSVLAIPLIQFCIMYIGVNLNSFILAFKSYNVGTDGSVTINWVYFDNFKQVFNDIFRSDLFSTMFLNSLTVYAVHLIAGMTLALFFSYYIYKKFIGVEFFRFMLILPSVISAVAFVLIFKYIADRFFPQIFGGAGLLTGNPRHSFRIIMAFNLFIGFGTSVLMYSNAMSRIPDSLIESAQLEGCSVIREFFEITLPLIYPTLETFLIVGLSNLFIDQANLFTFYTNNADPQIQTVGYYLFNQVFTERSTMSTYPVASAWGLMMTVITVPVVFTAKYFLDKLDKGVEF